MTQQDADTLAPILVSADGYCGPCGQSLLKQAAQAFPQVDWCAAVQAIPNQVMFDEYDHRAALDALREDT